MQVQSSSLLENTFINKIADLQNQHSEFELELHSKSNDIEHKEEEVKVLRDALMERINNTNNVSSPNFIRKRKGLTAIFSRKSSNSRGRIGFSSSANEDHSSIASSINNHALPVIINTQGLPPRSIINPNSSSQHDYSKNLLAVHSDIQQLNINTSYFVSMQNLKCNPSKFLLVPFYNCCMHNLLK